MKSFPWAVHGVPIQSHQTLISPSSGSRDTEMLRCRLSPQRAGSSVAGLDYGIGNGACEAILGPRILDAAGVVERTPNTEAEGPGPNVAPSTSLRLLPDSVATATVEVAPGSAGSQIRE